MRVDRIEDIVSSSAESEQFTVVLFAGVSVMPSECPAMVDAPAFLVQRVAAVCGDDVATVNRLSRVEITTARMTCLGGKAPSNKNQVTDESKARNPNAGIGNQYANVSI